jgi:hypothetical protein
LPGFVLHTIYFPTAVAVMSISLICVQPIICVLLLLLVSNSAAKVQLKKIERCGACGQKRDHDGLLKCNFNYVSLELKLYMNNRTTRHCLNVFGIHHSLVLSYNSPRIFPQQNLHYYV